MEIGRAAALPICAFLWTPDAVRNGLRTPACVARCPTDNERNEWLIQRLLGGDSDILLGAGESPEASPPGSRTPHERVVIHYGSAATLRCSPQEHTPEPVLRHKPHSSYSSFSLQVNSSTAFGPQKPPAPREDCSLSSKVAART